MRAEEKPKFIKELREIHASLDIKKLLSNPDDPEQIAKINRAIAILKNFNHGSGITLEKKHSEFQKWCRAGKRPRHSEILANEISQFINQKTEEMDIYVIEPNEKVFLEILNKLKKVQKLISDGLVRPEEKLQVLEEAKQKSQLFQDELYKRRAEKTGKQTIWSKQTRDGFVASDESSQLQPWIDLFENYLGQSKIKRRLESEGLWVQSNIQGEDEHLFIGKRDGLKDKVHMVIDGGTGEIRIDPKDQTPHDLVDKVETILTTKTGEKIRSTRTSLEFLEDVDSTMGPNVSVYTSDKGDRFLLELYNSGNEDVENFVVEVFWKQPEGEQSRILEKFIEENEDPVMTRPHKLNILRKGERKFAVNIPSISTDKKIGVSVSCVGISSKKKFNKEFEFETPNQYKLEKRRVRN